MTKQMAFNIQSDNFNLNYILLKNTFWSKAGSFIFYNWFDLIHLFKQAKYWYQMQITVRHGHTMDLDTSKPADIESNQML